MSVVVVVGCGRSDRRGRRRSICSGSVVVVGW